MLTSEREDLKHFAADEEPLACHRHVACVFFEQRPLEAELAEAKLQRLDTSRATLLTNRKFGDGESTSPAVGGA